MNAERNESLRALIGNALDHRLPSLCPGHDCAIRLFNGFLEGYPPLVVELYGKTLVLSIHKLTGADAESLGNLARDYYLSRLAYIDCVIVKQRSAEEQALKNGKVVYGGEPDRRIIESGVLYAIDLMMNQDTSFYLDTRNLRAWIMREPNEKEVLNTFAYTGSLGVAALAGGASRVVQIDRNGRFLEMAAQSAAANGLDQSKMRCTAVDFFVGVGQMKSRRELFELVILDPPYFSVTEKGKVDQVTESTRLINKVRPLVRDGGRLVVVNNALFLSGRDFYSSLEELGKGGYVNIEETIDIPDDVAGYPETRVKALPVDPAPFNHSTKIVVLRINRK